MSKDTSFHHDCGKGSRPRPYEVSQEEFTKKFDAIDWSVKTVDTKINHVTKPGQLMKDLGLEESGCSTTVEVTKADEG